jgi:RHS repeat-associated protein
LSAVFGLQSAASFFTYDANGNVGQLLDAAAPTNILAHYEYSPFGETIVAVGELAEANPFRFSTKYHERESGLVYYGHRFYSPETGRWMSRDPIGEEGGVNVYVFVLNAPVNLTDAYGLFGNPVCGPDGCYYPPDPCWGNCPDLPPMNFCAWGEKMAKATTSNKIGLVHLLERLPGFKGKEFLFNYFGFTFDCASSEKATGAYIAKTLATSDREELYYDTANPAWVPGNPKYQCGGGSGKVSVQTRIWWRFLPSTTGGDVFANLKTIVVVCYKCKCDEDCN